MVILTITNIIMFGCAAILFSCNLKNNSIIKELKSELERTNKCFQGYKNDNDKIFYKFIDLSAEHAELLRKVKTLENIDALKFDSAVDYKDAIRKITEAYERQHNCNIKHVDLWKDGEVDVKM